MTGKLALDEHGDRVGAYDVLFFNSSVGEAGEFVKFAEWDKTSAMSGSADNQRGGNGGINTFKTVEGQPVVYVGGVSEKPKATLQIFEALDIVAPGSGLGIFAILLCAICVLVLLGLMVIVSVQRNNPIFKVSVPSIMSLSHSESRIVLLGNKSSISPAHTPRCSSRQFIPHNPSRNPKQSCLHRLSLVGALRTWSRAR